MLDWRKKTHDPNDQRVHSELDAFFRSITRVEETSRREMILDFVHDKDVLDVGAAGHAQQDNVASWEHGLIKKTARKTVAAELNKDQCDYYNARGFDFRHVDATSDVDLGDRFDCVFIGDVIEHVNDPVLLLQFAKRHLKPGGRILITTPNPFSPRFRQSRGRRGARYVIANLEHTRWITVSNIYELALRAGLELTALRWPLLKKPKQGFARTSSLFAKKCLLAVAPLEDVFTEYAFELADVREKPSPLASGAERAAAQAQ